MSTQSLVATVRLGGGLKKIRKPVDLVLEQGCRLVGKSFNLDWSKGRRGVAVERDVSLQLDNIANFTRQKVFQILDALAESKKLAIEILKT